MEGGKTQLVLSTQMRMMLVEYRVVVVLVVHCWEEIGMLCVFTTGETGNSVAHATDYFDQTHAHGWVPVLPGTTRLVVNQNTK